MLLLLPAYTTLGLYWFVLIFFCAFGIKSLRANYNS
jgi:hypothetical protein